MNLKAGNHFSLRAFLTLGIFVFVTFCITLLTFFAFKNIPSDRSKNVYKYYKTLKQVLYLKVQHTLQKNQDRPMMAEEYKIALIVECHNSTTTKVWSLRKK